MPNVTSGGAAGSVLGRIRAFVGNTFVAHSRSFNAMQTELGELRRSAAAMSEQLARVPPDTQMALQEKQDALIRAEGAYHASDSALRETQDALRASQSAFKETQDALFHTQEALFQTQGLLRLKEDALREAQGTPPHTRDSLRQADDPTRDTQRGLTDTPHVDGGPVPATTRLPSIFLAAIPKSAGMYINNTLIKGLGFKHYDVTLDLFPYDLIIWYRWAAFFEGNRIAHHHIDASPANLWYVKVFRSKLVVHVRDPRAVLLSWIHHLSANTREAELLPHPVIAPPDEYYGKPLAWKIDWMIDHHLQVFTGWMEGWLDAEPLYPKQLLFTQYEDFVRDGPEFLNRILDFYGIPRSRFVDPALPLVRDLNFRTGLIEEWREVFDPEQRRRASAAVPSRLYERFGWNDDSGGVSHPGA